MRLLYQKFVFMLILLGSVLNNLSFAVVLLFAVQLQAESSSTEH